jgi:peptide deformylase
MYTDLSLKIFPNSVLRAKAEAFDSFEALDVVSSSMLDIMYTSKGIGLAANQVGLAKRIFVMDTSEFTNSPMVFINPVILESSQETNTYEEGCLSLPGVYHKITRPKVILVKWFDSAQKEYTQEFSGLDSTCIQHEIDHLDGILFPDRIPQHKQQQFWAKYFQSIKKNKGQA